MASADASPSPKKNVACRVTMPMYDNSGAHLSGGLSGLAAKITKDAGTEVSTTNTPVEIATNSSKVYLDLTSTEMNADTVAVVITCTNTNANPTDFVIYTQSSGKIAVDVQSVAGTAQTARDLGASVLLSPGTGTGQVSLSSGAVLLQPTQTGVTIPTVTNLTNAATSGDLTATMKTSIAGLTIARVTLTDTATTVTNRVAANTEQFGGSDIVATLGRLWVLDGSGNAVAPASTALTAEQVWDLDTTGHTTSGTFGAAAVAAGGSGDPWSTSLPGAYGSGTAGYILGTNLNALITSRMATFTLPSNFSTLAISGAGAVTAGTVGDKAGYALTSAYDPAKTGAPTASQVATTILTLDWTTVSGEADRSVLQALRFIRNGFSVSGSTLNVLGEDDSTTKWSRTLTTDPTAAPITGVS